jgi:hypothetical protein
LQAGLASERLGGIPCFDKSVLQDIVCIIVKKHNTPDVPIKRLLVFMHYAREGCLLLGRIV